jgi:hypothetical protein
VRNSKNERQKDMLNDQALHYYTLGIAWSRTLLSTAGFSAKEGAWGGGV